MGTTIPSVATLNKKTMRRGKKLEHDQQLQLCETVAEQAIYDRLCSIGDDKAPEVDGYNAVFYKKKAWPIIKNEVIEAVNEFFITGTMFRGINCTAVTLITKVASLATIKEYRPSACCTVLYKIIAKVLVGKIQKVIASIITETQLDSFLGEEL
ncbi:uncharacterized protein [Nicotiana tomentosiformis]|uniref:uncharacterized protein n=1 Tax=Nicotiana tomentosiformis TaxID=4098 RepID=UPI00388C5EE1